MNPPFRQRILGHDWLTLTAFTTFLFLSCVAGDGVAQQKKKSVKVRGFVTTVHSQNSFEIDDYRIMREASVTLEFDREDDDTKQGEISEDQLSKIRVGTELEIKGEYDPATGELQAKSLKLFTGEARKLKRTALLEQVPDLQKQEKSWVGVAKIDGQLSIAITRSALIPLTFPPSANDTSSHDRDAPAAPLPSPDRRTAPV